MSGFDSQARRRALRAIAAMEFRVGLYLWLTRVRWPGVMTVGIWFCLYGSGLGTIRSWLHIPALCSLPGLAWERHPWAALNWGLASVLLGVASAACTIPAPYGGRSVLFSPFPLLLPLRGTDRALACLAGRLGALLTGWAPALSAMALSWVAFAGDSGARPDLRALGFWLAAGSALLGIVHAGRFIVYGGAGRRGGSAGAATPKPVHAVWRRCTRWAGELRWVTAEGVRRATLPRFEARKWAAPAAMMLARTVLDGAVIVVAWAAVRLVTGSRPEAGLVALMARACLVVLPLMSLRPVMDRSVPGVIYEPYAQVSNVLPVRPGWRWRGQLPATLAYAAAFAVISELLGAGGSALACLLAGPNASVPPLLYWLPALAPAVALIAWAQGLLLRYPARLVEGIEWGWGAFALMTLLPGIALLAGVWNGEGNWLGAVALSLWPMAALVVAAARITDRPGAWGVNCNGWRTSATHRLVLLVIILSAVSVATILLCGLVPIFASLQ